jgi:hypothetical protein
MVEVTGVVIPFLNRGAIQALGAGVGLFLRGCVVVTTAFFHSRFGIDQATDSEVLRFADLCAPSPLRVETFSSVDFAR